MVFFGHGVVLPCGHEVVDGREQLFVLGLLVEVDEEVVIGSAELAFDNGQRTTDDRQRTTVWCFEGVCGFC